MILCFAQCYSLREFVGEYNITETAGFNITIAEGNNITKMKLPLRASDVDFVSDVHYVSDVAPYGVVGKHYITATNGSNIIMRRLTP